MGGSTMKVASLCHASLPCPFGVDLVEHDELAMVRVARRERVDVQRTKVPPERQQLRRGERLLAKEEHQVFE